MQLHKQIPTLTGIMVILVAALVFFGGAFCYQAIALAQLSKIQVIAPLTSKTTH
jgi:hypothetical protein